MNAAGSSMAGFTLLEVLVALTLFSLVSISMTPAFLVQLKNNHLSEVKSGAFTAAQITLDQLRTLNPESMPGAGSSEDRVVNVGERSYAVHLTYCEETAQCTARARFLRVRVSYQGAELYAVSTIFARLR